MKQLGMLFTFFKMSRFSELMSVRSHAAAEKRCAKTVCALGGQQKSSKRE